VLNILFVRLSVCQLTLGDHARCKNNRVILAPAGELLEDTFPYPPPQIAAHGLRRLTANQSKATFATQHCQLFKELSLFECFCGLIQQPTIWRCFRSRSVGPFPS